VPHGLKNTVMHYLSFVQITLFHQINTLVCHSQFWVISKLLVYIYSAD